MPPRHSARYNDKSRIYAANSIYQWHFQHFLLEVSTLPLVPLFMSIGICHYTAFTVFSPAAVRYEVVTKAVDSGMSKAERYPLSSHRLLSVLPVKCSTNDADCICVWSCELSNQFSFPQKQSRFPALKRQKKDFAFYSTNAGPNRNIQSQTDRI